MMQGLPQSRLLALLLLLLVPGVAGTALRAAHPCPVDAPWMAGRGSGSHSPEPAGQHHGSHSAGDTGDGTGHQQVPCSCIGDCQQVAPASLPIVALVTQPTNVELPPPPTPAQVVTLPVWRPGDRLPPSTAPPHA